MEIKYVVLTKSHNPLFNVHIIEITIHVGKRHVHGKGCLTAKRRYSDTNNGGAEFVLWERGPIAHVQVKN